MEKIGTKKRKIINKYLKFVKKNRFRLFFFTKFDPTTRIWLKEKPVKFKLGGGHKIHNRVKLDNANSSLKSFEGFPF
jgi:hypothetical protein